MENDIKPEVDEVEESTDLPEGAAEEQIDWKAEANRLRGIAKRNETRLKKLQAIKVESATEPKKEPSEKATFDYAEKAFLRANGIQADEYPLVLEVMQSTGKSLDDVLDAKYFQAELKERREAKASKDAIPSGTKRTASSTRDTVDYWLAKGELPPLDQRELRQQVVNARIKAETAKSQFTDRPVV